MFAYKTINMFLWFLILILLTVGASIHVACQSAKFEEGRYGGQGVEANYSQGETPAVVVATHEDGSQTVTAVPPAASTQPARIMPTSSPVVAVTVVPGKPAVASSYKIKGEASDGDRLTAFRCCTWNGEAPGTVVEKVATQRQAVTRNALPPVSVDATGIHAAAGGGSSEEQAGLSIWQRAGVWLSDLFKGGLSWLLLIGLGVGAYFILPMALPFLKPLFASIGSALHAAWTWITGEFSKLFAWVKNFHKSAPAASAPPTAASQVAPKPPIAAPAVTTTTPPPAAG